MSFATKISNEEVAALPVARFDGEIILVENEDALERACQYLLKQRVLGFDTETRPSFTPKYVNKVALLQLSTNERCYLIRLCRVGMSRSLVKVLERSNIAKVGVAVSGDIASLHKIAGFTPRGFVELQNEVVKFGIEELGLRKMASIVLGTRVSKAQRLSNWEAASLTDRQQMYAATDAWSCLKIYESLRSASS